MRLNASTSLTLVPRPIRKKWRKWYSRLPFGTVTHYKCSTKYGTEQITKLFYGLTCGKKFIEFFATC